MHVFVSIQGCLNLEGTGVAWRPGGLTRWLRAPLQSLEAELSGRYIFVVNDSASVCNEEKKYSPYYFDRHYSEC